MSNIFTSAVLNRLSDRNTAAAVQPNLDRNTAALEKLVKMGTDPFIFIQSNGSCLSSNVADAVMIIQSPVMRQGQRGIVEDLNVNFTTIAGTVRIVKVRGQDGLILVDVVRTITASTSGTGSVVLEEGEALAIVGQSAGAGVFSVFMSGHVQNVRT